jgi:tetratricopeptide (TPR) repeat protein
MKSIIILLIAILPLINTSAQRNKDTGGRGTESTRKDRINRIRNDSDSKPKTVEVKNPRSYSPNNFSNPKRPGRITICADRVIPGGDVVTCRVNSPELYNEMDTDLEHSLIDLGLQEFEEGNYYGAISIFDEEINLNPHVKELYFWRGKAFIAVNEFEKAIRDFSTAITFDNYYSEAYYQRGLARFYSGDRRKSKEDLMSAYSLGYSRAGFIINKYF